MLMAVMMSPREQWTDERLDDLNKKVDNGFAELKAETRERFDRIEAQVDNRFDETDRRLGRLEEGFSALNRTLFAGAIVIAAALVGSTATLAGIALV
jgi:tetrahydromethanopterin S-methyltransferase subunit G